MTSGSSHGNTLCRFGRLILGLHGHPVTGSIKTHLLFYGGILDDLTMEPSGQQLPSRGRCGQKRNWIMFTATHDVEKCGAALDSTTHEA